MVGGSSTSIDMRRSNMWDVRRVEQGCAFIVVLFIVFTTLYVIISRRINPCLTVNKTEDSSLEEIAKVNLTGLTTSENKSYVSPEGLVFTPGSYREGNDGTVFGFPCKIRKCVTKCCPENQSFVKKSGKTVCMESNITSFKEYFESVDVLPVNDKSCSVATKRNISRDELYIVINNLYKPGTKTYNLLAYYDTYFTDYGGFVTYVKEGHGHVAYWNQSMYCVSHSAIKDKVTVLAVAEDYVTTEPSYKPLLRKLAVSVSIPFTVATLVVYLSLSELKTLHGKSLISHVTSLTLAYLALAAVHFQVVTVKNEYLCQVIGFIIQFGLLGSFFWLNLMSYDVWRAFSGTIKSPTRINQNAKFVSYSCYGWGAPLVITALSIIVDFTPGTPAWIKPNVGSSLCWFEGNDSQAIFFYLPTGVLMTLNTMMFVTTFWRIWENSNSSKAFPKDSQLNGQPISKADHIRFYLYLKLSVAMGLTWMIEVLMFVLEGDSWIWFIGDISNNIQGVVIFIVFVCNKRTLKIINSRLNLNLGSCDDASNSTRLTSDSISSSKNQSRSLRVNFKKDSSVEL